MSKINQSNPKKHYEWCVMPQVYIATSLKIHKAIEIEKNLYDSPISYNICDEVDISGHADYHFIYPVVYNFKHGIELWLKGIGNINHVEYLYSHDLFKLFNFTKNKLENNYNNLIDKYNAIKDADTKVFNECKEQGIKIIGKPNDFKNHLNEFSTNVWPIIKKYYYGTYISSNACQNKPDLQNEAERYPEVSRPKVYKIPFDYSWVTYDIISNLIRDIEEIYRIFRLVMTNIEPTKKSRFS